MPYYPQVNLLFIHIPKTGGTVIENNIKKKKRQRLYSGKTNKLLHHPFNKKSLQHQFYTTLYDNRKKLKINFNNIKIFSVVRCPYDRIISALFWNKLIKKDFKPNRVFRILKNHFIFRDNLDNHNVPQYKFITDKNLKLIPNIKIFKTEELNEKNNELNNYIGININIKKKITNKDYSKYLNKDSIKIINKFYKKDFELFGYEMKKED